MNRPLAPNHFFRADRELPNGRESSTKPPTQQTHFSTDFVERRHSTRSIGSQQSGVTQLSQFLGARRPADSATSWRHRSGSKTPPPNRRQVPRQGPRQSEIVGSDPYTGSVAGRLRDRPADRGRAAKGAAPGRGRGQS